MTFDGSEFREYPEHRDGTWHGYYEDAKDEEERPMKEAERARVEAEEEAERVRFEAEMEAERVRFEAERDAQRARDEAERARIAALPPRVSAKDKLRERRRQKRRDAAGASEVTSRMQPLPLPPAPLSSLLTSGHPVHARHHMWAASCVLSGVATGTAPSTSLSIRSSTAPTPRRPMHYGGAPRLSPWAGLGPGRLSRAELRGVSSTTRGGVGCGNCWTRTRPPILKTKRSGSV